MRKLIRVLNTIKSLIDINEYEGLEEWCNDLKYCHSSEIITEKLLALLDQHKYNEALVMIEDYLKEHDDSDLIYHYCSVDSFFKIIESKSLWLSDSRYMNDRYEGSWVDQLVDKSLSEIDEQDKILEFKEHYRNEKSKKYYLFCLSKNGDQLSQWRGYADDGKGVAICFSRKSLKLPEAIKFPVGILDLIYSEKEQDRLIDDSIQQLADVLADINFLKEFAIWFKNPSFKEEDETRIVYTPENSLDSLEFVDPNMGEYVGLLLNNISKAKFRVRDNEIIPYYEYDLSCFFHSALIPRVVLGPKCKLDKDDLTAFLKSKGLENTEITVSESSYQ